MEHALNADARDAISAASMPASTIPLIPFGSSCVTRVGYAESGFARTSENRAIATMPGSTKMNTGRIFR